MVRLRYLKYTIVVRDIMIKCSAYITPKLRI
jgi:hypothetical protein